MTKKKKRKIGSPPGSLVYTGDKAAGRSDTRLVEYDAEHLRQVSALDEIPKTLLDKAVNWYDVRGLTNVEHIESIGRKFDIHPLILEDILDTSQRPKYEEFTNGFFLIFHAVSWDEISKRFQKEQVSIFCGGNFVLSFQELDTDLFQPVRERLESARGKIRQRGPDYLTYALADTLVDNYLHVLDSVQESMELLEDEVINHPSPQLKDNIHKLKREILQFRRMCIPMREAILQFQRDENPFIQEQTQIFLRDLVDHIFQATDSIDTFRDMLNSLQDLSLAELSFRMNNVMQLLTIISTIFIPLTFLVGVYGMNFEHMPELGWRYGYLAVWVLMITITLILAAFFRHKRWL